MELAVERAPRGAAPPSSSLVLGARTSSSPVAMHIVASEYMPRSVVAQGRLKLSPRYRAGEEPGLFHLVLAARLRCRRRPASRGEHAGEVDCADGALRAPKMKRGAGGSRAIAPKSWSSPRRAPCIDTAWDFVQVEWKEKAMNRPAHPVVDRLHDGLDELDGAGQRIGEEGHQDVAQGLAELQAICPPRAASRDGAGEAGRGRWTYPQPTRSRAWLELPDASLAVSACMAASARDGPLDRLASTEDGDLQDRALLSRASMKAVNTSMPTAITVFVVGNHWFPQRRLRTSSAFLVERGHDRPGGVGRDAGGGAVGRENWDPPHDPCSAHRDGLGGAANARQDDASTSTVKRDRNAVVRSTPSSRSSLQQTGLLLGHDEEVSGA